MGAHTAESDYLLETETGVAVETPDQLERANNLAHIERRNRILRLRRLGFTADAISEALARGDDEMEPFEISPRQINRVINDYMEELTTEDAETVETLRQIAHERLERMFKRLETDTHDRDGRVRTAAYREQLKVIDRMAKLHGLDAPQVHRHEGDVNHHVVANGTDVKRVEDSFARRHGGPVLELPTPDAAREVT